MQKSGMADNRLAISREADVRFYVDTDGIGFLKSAQTVGGNLLVTEIAASMSANIKISHSRPRIVNEPSDEKNLY